MRGNTRVRAHGEGECVMRPDTLFYTILHYSTQSPYLGLLSPEATIAPPSATASDGDSDTTEPSALRYLSRIAQIVRPYTFENKHKKLTGDFAWRNPRSLPMFSTLNNKSEK